MQKKLICLLFITMILQACSFPGVFKINVQQGNIITQDMLDKLTPGMTKKQVRFVLGSNLLDNVFNPNIEHYLYSYQKAGGEVQRQLITIYYQDDLLARYEGSLLEDNPAY